MSPIVPVITLIILLVYVIYRQTPSETPQITKSKEQGCYGNILFLLLLFFPSIILILGVQSLINDPSGSYRDIGLQMVLFGSIGPVFLIYRLWAVYRLRQGGLTIFQALSKGLRLYSASQARAGDKR
jgi:hypothetical protein